MKHFLLAVFAALFLINATSVSALPNPGKKAAATCAHSNNDCCTGQAACCAENAACCQEGAACCHEQANCCSEQKACCEKTAAACSHTTVYGTVAAVTPKAAACPDHAGCVCR